MALFSAACRSIDCIVNAVAEKSYRCPAVERATYVYRPALKIATGLRYQFCFYAVLPVSSSGYFPSITALPIINLFQKIISSSISSFPAGLCAAG